MTAGRLADAAPRLVGDPGDRASRRRDLRHQRVGRGETGLHRCCILVLETKRVAGPARRPVQGDSGTQHHVVALVECVVVLLGQDQIAALRPPQRLRISDPAVAVLQVRLEDVGHVAGAELALTHALAQLAEPTLLAPGPVGLPGLDDRATELGVAGDRSSREQRGRRVQVGLGESQMLVDGPHGMTELQATSQIGYQIADAIDSIRFDFDSCTSSRSMSLCGDSSPRRNHRSRPARISGARGCSLAGLFGQRPDPVVGGLSELMAIGPPTDARVVDRQLSTLEGRRLCGCRRRRHASTVGRRSPQAVITSPSEHRHRLPGAPREPWFVQRRVDVGPRRRAESVDVVGETPRRMPAPSGCTCMPPKPDRRLTHRTRGTT